MPLRSAFFAPGDPGQFHNNYNFCWCAAILGGFVGGYRWWALRRLPSPNDREGRRNDDAARYA